MVRRHAAGVKSHRLPRRRGQASIRGMALPPIASDLADMARTLLEALRLAHHDGTGITRETYGAGETAAMRRVEAIASEAGLDCAGRGLPPLDLSLQICEKPSGSSSARAHTNRVRASR